MEKCSWTLKTGFELRAVNASNFIFATIQSGSSVLGTFASVRRPALLWTFGPLVRFRYFAVHFAKMAGTKTQARVLVSCEGCTLLKMVAM